MVIKIDKAATLNDVDNYYKQLYRIREVDGKVDIMLPKILENNFVGLVPAVIQFLITWIRNDNVGNILLDINDPGKEDFNILFENELLFPAYILAWNKSDFFNYNSKIDIRSYLKEPLASMRNSMVKVNSLKGSKMLLLSIDHFPFSSGGLPAFETPTYFIDNPANTYRNLKSGLDAVLSFSFEAKTNFDEYRWNFVSIIHELFKNTYEWARTDYNNIAVDPSIRGILVKFYKKRRSSLLSEYNMHKGLREYFGSDVLAENKSHELYFIEISVFDSGAGFVKKYQSSDKDKLSDIDIIKKCLMLHMTSSRGLEKDDKGVGLDQILKILSNKGLLKIKTGKYCVYRNMITHPYKEVSNLNDLELLDWANEQNNNYSEQPETGGAAITIIYPLATTPAI